MPPNALLHDVNERLYAAERHVAVLQEALLRQTAQFTKLEQEVTAQGKQQVEQRVYLAKLAGIAIAVGIVAQAAAVAIITHYVKQQFTYERLPSSTVQK